MAFLLGLAVCGGTLLFTYAVTYVCSEGVSAVSELLFNRTIEISSRSKWIVSGCFVALLCLSAVLHRDFDFGDYPRRSYARFPHSLGGAGAIAFLLAYPGTSSRMISDLLHTGPRLLLATWHLAREAVLLTRVDVPSCGCVLAFIAQQSDAATWEELSDTFPEMDWRQMHDHLPRIRGVIYLEKGLSMTPALRGELVPLIRDLSSA